MIYTPIANCKMNYTGWLLIKENTCEASYSSPKKKVTNSLNQLKEPYVILNASAASVINCSYNRNKDKTSTSHEMLCKDMINLGVDLIYGPEKCKHML